MPAPEFLHPVRAEVSKPFAQSSTRLFDAFRCRSVAAAGDSPFFLLRQNKVSQKKATRSPARTGGGRIRIRIWCALSPLRGCNVAMLLGAACARIHWARGQNYLEKRPLPISPSFPFGLSFIPVRAEPVEASFPFVLRYRRIGLRYRSHSRKTVRAEPVEAFCSIRHGVFLISPDAALSPRPATHLFLLRQNKVSQKKATRSLGFRSSAHSQGFWVRGRSQNPLILRYQSLDLNRTPNFCGNCRKAFVLASWRYLPATSEHDNNWELQLSFSGFRVLPLRRSRALTV